MKPSLPAQSETIRCTCRAVIAPVDMLSIYECPQHGYYAKAAEITLLRDDYRDLLCAHPDRQYQALQAYLASNVDGRRIIDAAREAIASGQERSS